MLIRELTVGLRFPEGPVAMDDGSVIVVEMAEGRITRVKPDGTKHNVATPGGGPNGLAMGPDGFLYCCNNGGSFVMHERFGLLLPGPTPPSHKGGRIERINVSTGNVEVLYSQCEGHNLIGPNDLVFDNAGGFWFTDLGSSDAQKLLKGALYYAKADGSKITKIVPSLLTPNGVGLSPDGKSVYYAESTTGRLFEVPLSAPGVAEPPSGMMPSNFVGAYPGLAYFDSLGVQADGGVCVATILAGGISTFWPGTDRFEHTPLPDPICTNICWGGKDMTTAYVTLSGTGKLLSCQWRSPGLRLAYNG